MLLLQHGEDLFGPPPLTWPGAYLAAHDDVQEELEDAESSDEEPESTNAKAVVQSDQDTDSDVEPELSVDVSVKYPTLHFQKKKKLFAPMQQERRHHHINCLTIYHLSKAEIDSSLLTLYILATRSSRAASLSSCS